MLLLLTGCGARLKDVSVRVAKLDGEQQDASIEEAEAPSDASALTDSPTS
jgi:hypothetical protein